MTKEIKFESIEDRISVAKKLRSLAEGIEKGDIVLSGPDKTMVLNPSDEIKLIVKVKRKNGKVKLSLKCYWDEEAKLKIEKKKELFASVK